MSAGEVNLQLLRAAEAMEGSVGMSERIISDADVFSESVSSIIADLNEAVAAFAVAQEVDGSALANETAALTETGRDTFMAVSDGTNREDARQQVVWAHETAEEGAQKVAKVGEQAGTAIDVVNKLIETSHETQSLLQQVKHQAEEAALAGVASASNMREAAHF